MLARCSRSVLGLACALGFVACDGARPKNCAAPRSPAAATEWPSYGNDPGGTRFAALGDLTPENVACLERAWTYRTGDLPDSRGEQSSTLASEVTPILVDGSLYVCTPYNRVIALDPETGAERWAFDPEIDLTGHYGNQLVCRGVSTWLDAEAAPGAVCRRRILTATNDARLFALDASTGKPCSEFGNGGSIDLNPGAGPQEWRGEYQVTSPPAISRDAVIVGAAVSDNQRNDAPSGVVRAYDARTGALRWAWDLRPPGFVATPENTSAEGYALATPNAWAPMAVDAERDLVFVPTGNPAPDYYRGDSNIDYYGSSVVALRASSGEVVWRFQTVHRDLWDFDVPAQPTLFTLRREGQQIPALVQATKMGLLFVLNRETGEPLFPVEERPVPQLEVPGEKLSPTQPFPLKPPPLARQTMTTEELTDVTPESRAECAKTLSDVKIGEFFQPTGLEFNLHFPGGNGGANWGGASYDPVSNLLFVNTMDVGIVGKMMKAPEGNKLPYRWRTTGRGWFWDSNRYPCQKPPWGRLTAIDLDTGSIRWQVTLGVVDELAARGVPPTGTPNIGGPIVTAGGLVFIGATNDSRLRAFDKDTGRELWSTRLPASGHATPMTFRGRRTGKQYVVIAAGGGNRYSKSVSDALVAYALP